MEPFIASMILVLSVCIDSFLACFSYGVSQIKIPIFSLFIINLIATVFIAISLVLGLLLKNCIPLKFLPKVRFWCLFFMGIVRLLDGVMKAYINKHGTIQNHIQFAFFNMHFILNIYSSPEKADIDDSKELTPKEAIALGTALSIDGIVIGIGAALTNISFFLTLLMTFITGLFLSYSGYKIGTKIASKFPFDFSFLSGICLLILAFLNI